MAARWAEGEVRCAVVHVFTGCVKLEVAHNGLLAAPVRLRLTILAPTSDDSSALHDLEGIRHSTICSRRRARRPAIICGRRLPNGRRFLSPAHRAAGTFMRIPRGLKGRDTRPTKCRNRCLESSSTWYLAPRTGSRSFLLPSERNYIRILQRHWTISDVHRCRSVGSRITFICSSGCRERGRSPISSKR